MFDIGFWELTIIAIVALLVIGPERLPAVARTLGFWLGKARKFVSSVQDDFNREVVKAEELKRLVEEQSKIKDVHEIIEHTVDESRKTVSVGAKLDKDTAATPELEGGRQPSADDDHKPQHSQGDNRQRTQASDSADPVPDDNVEPENTDDSRDRQKD
ncbi:MAG: Sec-independent protein translocase protein TatB [Gammaproteobacteria bacterium]|jgi:sec-independent protein translocase protein TatB